MQNVQGFKANDGARLFFVDSIASVNRGRCLSLKDMYSDKAAKVFIEDAKVHDANFAFLSTSLAKLHNKLYEPKWNTTYARDIPMDMGGGFVDYVEYYTVDWSAIMNEYRNVFGNAANYIPRVNAGLNQNKVNVFTFEVAYDLRFVDLEKMKQVTLQKSIETIYSNIITAGWDKFCQQIGYLGMKNGYGLFNSPKITPTTIDNSTATGKGFVGMTDEAIISAINGIIEFYLDGTDMNLALLPDTMLVPSFVGRELTSRSSALYTASLREYLTSHNLAIDESSGSVNFTIESRPDLNTLGTGGHGRMVVYKKDIDFVRMDIPYPMQHYITLPNIERMGYTSAFVGQVSEIQMPYNDDPNEMGVVSYWDFTTN
jgi:hypothetical protein